MKSNGTPIYARQHKGGLTLPQQSAIDLLASGKNDTETAELLKLSRTCVSKWRLYSPEFQAALNRRRAEVWASGIDRLRSLIPKALDALAGELEREDNPNRLKAAVEILRLVPLPAQVLATGQTDAEEIVRGIVTGRRNRAHGPLDEILDNGKGLPPFSEQMKATWEELEAMANAPDSSGTERDGVGEK